MRNEKLSTNPQVSIIMPAYNSQDYIEEGISSILSQTFQDFELIVVDDGSTDATKFIVSRMASEHPAKIIFLEHPHNKGAAAARNTGIQNARADILMFADADDIQHPQRLEITLQTLLETGVEMVFHDCELVDQGGNSLHRKKGYPEDLTNENAALHLLKRNHLLIGLALMRRSEDLVLDESLPNAEDFELFLRFILQGRQFHIVRQALTQYRIHYSNISSNGALSNQSVQKILTRLPLSDLYSQLEMIHGEVKASVAIAAAYLWRNEPCQAIKLLEGKPLSAEGYFTLGVSYYKTENYEKSLRCFEELENGDLNAAVVNNIGVLRYLVHGETKDAHSYFLRALQLQSGYLDARNNLEALQQGKFRGLKITDRPLRKQLIHTTNYKLN